MQLVRPNKQYLSSVYEAIEEYKTEPSVFDVSIIKQMIEAEKNDFADYFENVKNAEKGIGLKEGYVPDTVYWLVDEKEYVGSFDLRHCLTPYLCNIGGHIAYEIRPKDRCKGYAYQGLKLCLKEANKRGIDKVLVTCNAKNLASYKVMHKVMLEYGGYEDVEFIKDDLVEKRVWIKTC